MCSPPITRAVRAKCSRISSKRWFFGLFFTVERGQKRRINAARHLFSNLLSPGVHDMLKKLLMLLLAITLSIGAAFAAVDVNTADQSALESVKGLGPVKSKAIIDERSKNGPFKDADDLATRVKGLGTKSVSNLEQEGLTIGGSSAPPSGAKPATRSSTSGGAPARSTTKSSTAATAATSPAATTATTPATTPAASTDAASTTKAKKPRKSKAASAAEAASSPAAADTTTGASGTKAKKPRKKKGASDASAT
jgi:competence protein ComEA